MKLDTKRMAGAEFLDVSRMTEAELRQWVDANPGRVNDGDQYGDTALYAAVFHLNSLPLALWFLDEKGADVNSQNDWGQTPLPPTPPPLPCLNKPLPTPRRRRFSSRLANSSRRLVPPAPTPVPSSQGRMA